VATSQVRGGTAFGIYPMDRFRRLELSTGLFHVSESFNENLQQYLDSFNLPRPDEFRRGMSMPLGVAFVQETTVFREFGPLSGSTMRLAYEAEPRIGNSLSSQTVDADARYYQRLATSGVLALRFRGFKSIGGNPRYMYFGGNSEMRGYNYLEFTGENVLFANAELRFPLIDAALTPIGVIGGIRGVFFANIGGGWFNDQNFTFLTSDSETFTPIVDYVRSSFDGTFEVDPVTGNPIPIYGPERTISGLRLKDGRASYGLGLETFLLGFPIHFDWSWRTLFNKDWEDAVFAYSGGSAEFRKPRFAMWIGYDF
jgi:outer membrane protein assembly factor BamA